VHELLLSVDPPPERTTALDTAPVPKREPLLPRRRRRALVLLAAALAARRSAQAGWPEPAAGRTSPEAGDRDERRRPGERFDRAAAAGRVRQLADARARARPQPSRDRADYYELWLTKDGSRPNPAAASRSMPE
jgi:hypothetical protein